MTLQLMRIVQNRNLWILSFAAAGLYLPVSLIGDLWGVTFLNIEAGLPTDTAGLITTLVFIGFAAGGVFAGHASDRLGRRKILFSSGAFGALCLSFALCFNSQLPVAFVGCLVAALDFTAGSQVLSFVMVADTAKRHNRAITMAFLNFIVMILPVVVQPAVGWLAEAGLSLGTTPSDLQELRGYSLIVILMLISAWLSCYVMETKPRKKLSTGY